MPTERQGGFRSVQECDGRGLGKAMLPMKIPKCGLRFGKHDGSDHIPF